ncbi:MAG: head decoration protein [Rhodospirillales bacterium]|nr:head decoration protein [Rhodospirillales bacterium]
MSGVLYEHYYDGAFLVSEEEAHRSRDSGVITNSTGATVYYDAGYVMVNAPSGTPVGTAASTNTGNGTIGSLSVQPGGQAGTYRVQFTGATAFRVFAPDGQELDAGATGTAYTEQVGFTITAGGTAFAAGDSFTIAVGGGWVPYTATTEPSPFAMGILFNRIAIGASSSRRTTFVTRQAQVNRLELVWDASVAAAGGIVGAANAGNTGTGTIGSLVLESAVLTGGVQPFVPAGTYTAVALSPTAFEVEDPTGQQLGIAQVGTAFVGSSIGFTITAGGTAFVEGDGFTITVTENGQAAALAALGAAGIIAR